MLSESLTDLEEKRLIKRTVVNEKPVRVEYSLTRHGRELEEAITALHGWRREYLTKATDPEEPII